MSADDTSVDLVHEVETHTPKDMEERRHARCLSIIVHSGNCIERRYARGRVFLRFTDEQTLDYRCSSARVLALLAKTALHWEQGG